MYTIFTGYLHTFYTLFTRVKKKFMCTCSFFRNFYIYTSTCTKNTHFCCCFVYFLFFFPFRSTDTTHSWYWVEHCLYVYDDDGASYIFVNAREKEWKRIKNHNNKQGNTSIVFSSFLLFYVLTYKHTQRDTIFFIFYIYLFFLVVLFFGRNLLGERVLNQIKNVYVYNFN